MNDNPPDRSNLSRAISDHLRRICLDDGFRAGIARAGWQFLASVATEARAASARQRQELGLRHEVNSPASEEGVNGDEPQDDGALNLATPEN